MYPSLYYIVWTRNSSIADVMSSVLLNVFFKSISRPERGQLALPMCFNCAYSFDGRKYF